MGGFSHFLMLENCITDPTNLSRRFDTQFFLFSDAPSASDIGLTAGPAWAYWSDCPRDKQGRHYRQHSPLTGLVQCTRLARLVNLRGGSSRTVVVPIKVQADGLSRCSP